MYEIDDCHVSPKVTLGNRMYIEKGDTTMFDFALAKNVVGKRGLFSKSHYYNGSSSFLQRVRWNLHAIFV
jgi:hypothetical protein